MQPGVLTKAKKNNPANVTAMTNEAEIYNGGFTRVENIQTKQNLVEHTPNGAMTDVNVNGQTEGDNFSEGVDVVSCSWYLLIMCMVPTFVYALLSVEFLEQEFRSFAYPYRWPI